MSLVHTAYQSLESCPIWNWQKTQSENDLRYLYKLKSYDKLPRWNNYRAMYLQAAYKKLLEQFTELNEPVLTAKRKVIARILELIIDIGKTAENLETIRNASVILRAMMITDDPNIEWLYDVDLTDKPTQKQKLSLLAVEIKKYHDNKKQSMDRPKVGLLEQTVRIETLLGLKIDERTTSVLRFLQYQRQAIEKIKILSNAG